MVEWRCDTKEIVVDRMRHECERGMEKHFIFRLFSNEKPRKYQVHVTPIFAAVPLQGTPPQPLPK